MTRHTCGTLCKLIIVEYPLVQLHMYVALWEAKGLRYPFAWSRDNTCDLSHDRI